MKVLWPITLFCCLVFRTACAISLSVPASKDNTLYEDELGGVSNGAGEYMFVGKTVQNSIRRAVIAFDLSAVPAGAVVRSAAVRLHMSKTIAGAVPIALHRLTANWGEGTSDAGSRGGMGVPPRPGDATWLHTFYNSQFWATPGGDFHDEPSAQHEIGAVGFYVWGPTPALAQDVTRWLRTPGQNFGWILISDEVEFPSAKRLDTRAHLDSTRRPSLLLEVDVPLKLHGPTIAGNHWTLSFTAQEGWNYALEGCAAPGNESWSMLTNIAAAPGLRTITIRRPLTANQQFYRVVAP